MSGPKGARYQVVSAAELEQRYVDEVNAQCKVLSKQIIEVCTRIDDEVAIEKLARQEPAKNTRQSVDAWHKQLNKALASVNKQLDEQRRIRRQELLKASFADFVGRNISLNIQEKTDAVKTSVNGHIEENLKVSDSGALNSGINKALDIVQSIEDSSDCEGFLEEAKRISALDDYTVAKAHLTVLQSQVEKKVKQQRNQHRKDEQRQELLLSFAHITGEDAEQLRKRTMDATSDKEMHEAAEAILSLIEHEKRVLDARFVAEQAQEILKKLGYMPHTHEEAEDGAESSERFIEQGGIVVERPDLPNHVLRVRVDEERAAIFTNVEALNEIGMIKAESAEEKICPDIMEVADQLKVRGIKTEWLFRREPGEVQAKLFVESVLESAREKTKTSNKQSLSQANKNTNTRSM